MRHNYFLGFQAFYSESNKHTPFLNMKHSKNEYCKLSDKTNYIFYSFTVVFMGVKLGFTY
jgi:hypothetical protein